MSNSEIDKEKLGNIAVPRTLILELKQVAAKADVSIRELVIPALRKLVAAQTEGAR